VFASYPTQVFDDRIVVMLAPLSDVRRLDEVLQTPMMNFAVEWFASRDVCLAMLDHLARHGPCEAGELYTIAARTGRPALQRTLGWLLKMDVIRLHQPLTIVDGDCAGDAADRSSRAESQTGNA